LKGNTLQSLVEVEEIAFVLPDIDVAEVELPVLFFKLQEYLVEFI
jgi:hypothetical protein